MGAAAMLANVSQTWSYGCLCWTVLQRTNRMETTGNHCIPSFAGTVIMVQQKLLFFLMNSEAK